MKNPLTWLMLAASTWILVLGVNQPWLSAAVVLGAQSAAVLRLRNFSVLFTTVCLSLPMGLSLLLVHAPFGEEHLLPLVTSDGLATAASLSLRFVALMSVFLLAAAASTIPELSKAMQGSRWLGSRVAYILGSAVHLLPQGRDNLAAVRDAHQLRGRRTRGPVSAVRHLALPLITRLLSTGASRAIPLEVAGLDLPGRRTLLQPVVEYRWEPALRLVFPLSAIGVALWL